MERQGGVSTTGNAHLQVVRAGFTWVLLRSPFGGVVARLCDELGGARRTSGAVVAGTADTGRGRVARPRTVEAGVAVGAVGGVGGAGKIVVCATRTRLLIRRPDRAVASGCCLFEYLRCNVRFDMQEQPTRVGAFRKFDFHTRDNIVYVLP